MEENKEKKLADLFEQTQTYVENRIEYTRLFLVKRGSRLVADMVTTTIVAISFTLAFILGTITLALFLSNIFHSYTAGFGSVALIYLIFALVVLMAKDNFIEKGIANMIIRKYFKKLEEDEEGE